MHSPDSGPRAVAIHPSRLQTDDYGLPTHSWDAHDQYKPSPSGLPMASPMDINGLDWSPDFRYEIIALQSQLQDPTL
jgi:hypothetical protein